MKKLYLILGLLLLTLTACPQSAEQTFKELVKFEKGFMLGNKIYEYIPTGISTVTWDLITGKPVNFLPTPHRHMWTDITNNPANMSAFQIIEELDYLPIPQKTTLEISKLAPIGHVGIVFNKTDTTIQVYYGGSWKRFILDR